VTEPSADKPPVGQTPHQRSGHAAYEGLHASEDFRTLRRKYRAFVVPWTIAFLSWYLLYVVMSSWATDFMDTKLWGHINVALVFGLLQFVTTFLLAWIYSRYSTSRLDPLARTLDDQYNTELGGRR
jgi:uncharacterized membrane protein (DUF485 family)